MKKLTLLLSLQTAVAFSATTSAAEVLTEIKPPQAVKILAGRGNLMAAPHYFKGPGNLIGVAGKTADGSGMVIYIDPAGQYVVAGAVVDLTNKVELSKAAALKWLGGTAMGNAAARVEDDTPKEADLSAPAWKGSAKAAMVELEKLSWIETGKGPGLIYAIVDPLCGHCKQAWKDISKWQTKNSVARVRWVPVSLGADESADLAASALTSGTPSALGKAIVDEVFVGDANQEKGKTLLKKNQAFIANFKDFATPTFLVIGQDKITAVVGFSGIPSILKPLGK